MKRSFTLITLGVLIVVSYGLYNLKYEVEDLQDHADALRAQMDEDRRAIKVLEAEWAYLSRPDRLQTLSEKFLTLEPTVARQVGGLADLRLKPMDQILAPQPALDATAAAAQPTPFVQPAPSSQPAASAQALPPAAAVSPAPVVSFVPPAAQSPLVPVASVPVEAILEDVQ
ncbi:MAG: hypothetical protein AB7O49_16985 [Sphingomonadales bacterium]